MSDSPTKKLKTDEKEHVKAILGTMEMGRRKCDQKLAHAMVDAFVAANFKELDTALMYCDGTTEKILGALPDRTKSQVLISTKANPWNGKGLGYDSILKQSKQSFTSLKFKDEGKCDIFYLHAPDHNTPIEQSLKAVNQLHQDGKFLRFGLSNYSAWQVAEIYYLCKENKYVLPTVYQGMYNAITRSVELELIPCLRRFGISFYAYNPLAGGLLTGRYTFEDLEKEPIGRFFGNSWAEAYRNRYWKKTNFDALENIKKCLNEVYGEGKVSIVEASLRWMIHHSALKSSNGDGVILGASSLEHLKDNLLAVSQGPLEKAVVDAFTNAWDLCKGDCPLYFR